VHPYDPYSASSSLKPVTLFNDWIVHPYDPYSASSSLKPVTLFNDWTTLCIAPLGVTEGQTNELLSPQPKVIQMIIIWLMTCLDRWWSNKHCSFFPTNRKRSLRLWDITWTEKNQHFTWTPGGEWRVKGERREGGHASLVIGRLSWLINIGRCMSTKKLFEMNRQININSIADISLYFLLRTYYYSVDDDSD